jgi:hypothetical protein
MGPHHCTVVMHNLEFVALFSSIISVENYFVLTVRFAFAIDGPCVRSVSTMGANPAQAERCNGLEPLSSALLHDASYVRRSSTMCLEK